MRIRKNCYKISFLLFLLFNNYLQINAQGDKSSDRYFEISKNLEIFSNIFKELNAKYVDPIEPGKMVKTAIDAMLEELDPYTVYISEADKQDFELQTSGKYGGIGTTLRFSKDSVYIFDECIENGPADKAGIKAGDIIVSIDGNNIKGKSEDAVALLFKGAPGTKINITIEKPIDKKTNELTIIRDEIQLPSVLQASLLGKDKSIAYIYLSQFIRNSHLEVIHALDSLKKIEPNLKGVILDLRGNPGGLLDEAIKVTNIFVDKNVLVASTKGKNQEQNSNLYTKNNPWDSKIPLAVLINHGSASASEIVSGTIQDLDRGVIIGNRSFGKGLVQTVGNLGYNTRLKLTISKYYTNSGRCIQALDYEHRNPDGSVNFVPDSLKTSFKTKNGRTVFDGGGIEPDIKIERSSLSKLGFYLLVEDHIFDFATNYYYNKPKIATPEKFKLSDQDFNEFLSFLEERKFTYKSDAIELLEPLEKLLKEDNKLDKVKSKLEELKNALAVDGKMELNERKEEISYLLTNEIVSRYYYQKGRILNALNSNDPEITKSTEVLQGASVYQELLKGKL